MKLITLDFVIAYLTPFVVFVAANRFNIANAQDVPLTEPSTNYIEYKIERLDVFPAGHSGHCFWNGSLVYHGKESIRVNEFDLNTFALECVHLSDTDGRVWTIHVPVPYIRPTNKTLRERYNIALRPDERRVLHDHKTPGRLLLLNGGLTPEIAVKTNAFPAEPRYFLNIKRKCANEPGDRLGEVTLSGAGILKVTWGRDEETQSNRDGNKP